MFRGLERTLNSEMLVVFNFSFKRVGRKVSNHILLAFLGDEHSFRNLKRN